MDGFEVGVLVIMAVAVLAACLAARANSDRRLGEFGARRRNGRSAADAQSARDAEDLAEMLAVTNARRRARGLPERSLADAIREFGDE